LRRIGRPAFGCTLNGAAFFAPRDAPTFLMVCLSRPQHEHERFTMGSELRGCWLKIERAKEHGDALHEEISKTLAIEHNRPRLGIKFDAKSGEHVLFVNQMPDLGAFIDRCSLILGDIVHNFTSALDRLAYRLALHAGASAKVLRQVQFSICDSAKAFAENGRLNGIDSSHIAIIERFQPYSGLNRNNSFGIPFHPLTTLRDLTNTDKHRLPIELIIPTNVLEAEHESFLDVHVAGTFQRLARGEFIGPFPLKLGTEIVRAKLPAGSLEADVDVAGYVIPQVALAEGHAVLDITAAIAAVVIKIVCEFEPLL
jgi:hypothetical protein